MEASSGDLFFQAGGGVKNTWQCRIGKKTDRMSGGVLDPHKREGIRTSICLSVSVGDGGRLDVRGREGGPGARKVCSLSSLWTQTASSVEVVDYK